MVAELKANWDGIWNIMHSDGVGPSSFIQMCCAANFPLGPWPKSAAFMGERAKFNATDAASKMMSLTTEKLSSTHGQTPTLKNLLVFVKCFLVYYSFTAAIFTIKILGWVSTLFLSKKMKFFSLFMMFWGFTLLYSNTSSSRSWIILLPPIFVSVGYYMNWISKPLYDFCFWLSGNELPTKVAEGITDD